MTGKLNSMADKPAETADIVREASIEAATAHTPANAQKSNRHDAGALSTCVLNSLTATIAVLDETGTIIAVNDRWREFARANGDGSLVVDPIGTAYLSASMIDKGWQPAGDLADWARDAITQVVTGRRTFFEMEYPGNSGTEQRWFRMRVSSLADSQPGTVVTHEDITDLKLAERQLGDSEARYRALFTQTTIPIILLHPDTGAFVDANEAAARFYGWDIETLKTMTLADVIAPAAAQADIMLRFPSLRSASSRFRLKNRTMAGMVRDVELTSAPVLLDDDLYLLCFVFVDDITERLQVEERNTLLSKVFYHARAGIMITDSGNRIVDVNEAFTRITGYTRDEVLGRNPRMLSSGRQPAEFYDAMWKTLETEGYWSGEVWNRRKDNKYFAESLTITVLRDEVGGTSHHIGLFTDITRAKDHENELRRIAHYDALTGLANRVLLADRLQMAIGQGLRRKASVAVVYLDLDGFKEVNDTHGHASGDQLLIAVAHRMKSTLRDGDTLARIGGDEFVAVLTDLTDRAACEQALQRLLAAASETVAIGDQTVSVTASIGATLCPLDGIEADGLMRQADQAMYIAKQSGKNRVHFFDSSQESADRLRQEAQRGIQRALSRGEFVLYYQPKVDMREGGIVGAEALIRWQHPEKGLLAPAAFLPFITGHGLEVEIGQWVIETALSQMAAWRAVGFDIPVSVNISASQMAQEFLPDLIRRLAAHPTMMPGALELELLESSALDNLSVVSDLIAACNQIGVRFALDDFGTGYSSLTYLRHLPVATLKIDQSFVRDMLKDSNDLAIVEGVLGLAKAFRCDSVAEGVETAELAAQLVALGCRYGQGYGFARPMPADDLPAWAADWNRRGGAALSDTPS
jgi:diguanylate cyclase (GGDEF)-like protein/PAS domain S-box-containing protein